MSELELYRPRREGNWLQRTIRSLTIGPFNLKDRELTRLLGRGRQTVSGVPVNEYTAMTYSAVWAAVNLIAGQIASVPLMLYKRRADGGKDRFDSHPLFKLLHDKPNEYMGSAVFRRQLTANRLIWGNGYAEIERDGAGRPVALWPLMPYAVQPFYAANGELRYRVANPNGMTVEFAPADMLHLRGLGSGDGICGDSMIPSARESFGLGLAAERFGSAFFGNGSTFGGVISYPPGVGGDARVRKENRDAIESVHTGVDRAHRFLALYEGAKYETTGVPPNAAQFLETREFQIEEVCRWFNVPPHKLKHLKRSTNNNIEQQAIEFQTDTLNPQWIDWEEELTIKLIAPLERTQQVIEHVRLGLLQADAVSRGEFYSKGFAIGGLTQNDYRRAENLNPFPDDIKADIPYVPSNMMPADLARDYWQAQIDKAKQPPPAPNPPPPADPNAAAAAGTEKKALEDQLLDARRAAQHAEDLRDLAKADADTVRAELVGRDATIAGLMGERDLVAGELIATRDTLQKAEGDRDVALTLAHDAEQARAVAMANATEAEQAAVSAEAARVAQGLANTEALELVNALRRTTEAELGGALARVEAAEQQRDAATQQVADLTAAIKQTTADLTSEQIRRTAAQEAITLKWEPEATAAAAEAETLRAELARARADIATELDRQRTHKAVMLAAMRSLFSDASARLLQKEIDRSRKHQATPDKLRAWIDQFYPLQSDSVRAAFQPIVGPWTALTGGTPDALLDRLVTTHLETSTTALRQVAEAEDGDALASALERTLYRWEHERADAMADALVREGMADHG